MIEDNDIVSWRGELEQAKDESGVALVSLYESGGKVFGFLPGFDKTQSRYKKFDPKYPMPPLEWLPPLSEEEEKMAGVDGTKKTPKSKPSDTKKTPSDTQAPPESHSIAWNRNRKGEEEGELEVGKIQKHPPTPPHRADGYYDGPKNDTDAIHRHFSKVAGRPALTAGQRANGEAPGLDEDIGILLDRFGLEDLQGKISETVTRMRQTGNPCHTLRKAINEIQKAAQPAAGGLTCAGCGSLRIKSLGPDKDDPEMENFRCGDCECVFEVRINPDVV